MALFLGPCSNGEYDPQPLNPVAAEAMRRTAAEAGDVARRLGWSRRRFLASACGTALGLSFLQACSNESGGGAGGRFTVPTTATTEPDAAEDAIGPSDGELVFDVQTHLLEGSGSFGGGFPQAECGEANCFTIEHFLELLFVRSDTSLAMLSAIPATAFGGPLSSEIMEQARRVAEAAECDGRILVQGQAIPTRPDNADHMRRVASEHRLSAWKAYTHVPAPGWRLDDATGEAFVATAIETGVPRIAVHKGLSGGSAAASPADVGPAAAKHPDVSFLVYHSGYESGNAAAVDRLVDSLARAGVAAGSNVYAELGSTWFNVMSSPDDAAHVLGKLLRAVGPDNVLWGTDSIWYGSPQSQLEAFRAFEITAEFQERFGYPALTPEVKRKVLGLNAAQLFDVEPAAFARCAFTRDELRQLRAELPPSGALGPQTAEQAALVRAADWAWQPAEL